MGSIVVPFGIPKYEPQKGTTMEPMGNTNTGKKGGLGNQNPKPQTPKP